MKVSILINNYNYAQFVGEALESALAQTHPDCEVIVVDDGSSDGSQEVISKFGNRVTAIFQRNQGQVAAFNRAFEVCTGDLILFLDSDDALLPDAASAAVAAWQPGVAKLQFPLEVVDPQGRRTGLLMPRVQLSDGDVLPQLLKTGRYVTPPTSGNVFARAFLDQVLPIPSGGLDHGDAYLSISAPFYGKIVAFKRPLGLYRVHGVSMSSIVYGGKVNLKQMEKLIGHAMQEKALLEKLARERQIPVSKSVVVSHWMHLKLRLSFYKLSTLQTGGNLSLLVKSGLAMLWSTLTAAELTVTRKLQNVVWTLGVLTLPESQASRLIAFAFDTAPKSGLLQFLRRA